ncbi:MAG: DUF3817 domain-containing protein [Bacteroidetes bacterium]|nr:MAG: DUF3817 domain-containing protein [Bacteroidota bacterium]REK06470.1 MAG: DUF3817 domain-containing protein [Bacteroidota bacterium]REK33236.1 MAG: DUF3817 domain-containing protein [Bacteroidota bacterium]REK47073.1 MAG: DUF3817 domain-containing protein [Bacteroidota bacterium]
MNLRFSSKPLGHFRKVALAEGTSFILLIIAMPFKYMMDMPLGVKYLGWAHGILFIWYMIALMKVWQAHDWGLKKLIVAFIASLIPFGTFIMDARWSKEDLGEHAQEKS